MLNNKILVIEDDKPMVHVVHTVLKEQGFNVLLAANGKEGLDLLTKEQPVVVLLDLYMPVMDGVTFLENIKVECSDPYSVIVLTGRSDDENIKKCFNLGVSYFLIKPCNVHVLLGMIKSSIKLKEAQLELKEYSVNLEIMVDDRTKELIDEKEKLKKAYDELKQSQDIILQQEKLAGLGQLAAGVAHEINNPTGFISSNLYTFSKYIERIIGFIDEQKSVIDSFNVDNVIEKINKKRKDLKIDYIVKDVKELIGESLEGTHRIKQIVQDLKIFVRKDDGEQEDTNINSCIESSLNIVWNELKYKSTVKKEIGDLPLIKCYPQQLKQVFMNILVNASQAIEERGEIKIKTWQEKESVFIAISDTGCGIPKKNLGKLFDPFFTTKAAGIGTGLGMGISYDIIKKHNGDIFVESEVGKGSTFTVTVPVA